MRRKDRLITEEETMDILENGEYGIVSTVSLENQPYGVPVNYCIFDNCIYFHSALEGKKIDNLTHNPRVSFCVVGKTEIQSDTFTTTYESCIVHGLVSEASNEEKQKPLKELVHKYSPDFVSQGIENIQRAYDKVRVFKISINSITGKANRKRGSSS